MAGYKSLQVADALSRISETLKPQITVGNLENSAFGQNTNAADPTLQHQRDVAEANQYYQSLYSKTGSDYAQDLAVGLGKGIVAVPQAAAGILDLVDAGMQLPFGEVQGGRVSKALADVGVDFAETQDIMKGWFSEGTQRQMQELAQLPGMSTEKSLGDNLSSLGQTAEYVLDNPSIALNTIFESLPSIAAGGAIGRGAAALGARSAAGAIGEGTVMAGSAQANMDRDAEGYTTGSQALGALGIGVLGGAVGQLGNRLATRVGSSDIDTIAAGALPQTTNAGFRSLLTGTATEAAEEAAQSSLENVISNISSGKDAIEGLNQDLVLGTLAGGAMGAAVNVGPSMKSAALNAVLGAAQRQATKIQERITAQAPEKTATPTEEFTDVTSENYNPSAAIIREASKVKPDTAPEEVAEVSKSVNTILESAESHLSSLVSTQESLGRIDTIRKNIEGGEAAVAKFQETEPAKAEMIQGVVNNLKAELETASAFEGKETELADAIKHNEGLVNEARTMHERFSGVLGQITETNPTEAPEAKVFGAPTSYTPEQLTEMVNDPNISEPSKVALRALSEAVVAQNAVKDIDAVQNQVMGKSLDPNYISTPQYLEQFGSAIKSGSTTAQNNLLTQIGSFEQSHTAKAKLATSALKAASAIGKSVQIVNQNGEWVVNTGKLLNKTEARENGALTIHPVKGSKQGSTELVNYLNTESKAITATRKAMEAMVQVQTPSSTTSPQQQAPATVEEAIALADQQASAPVADLNVDGSLEATTTIDPVQAELDAFNQEARESNEWQQASRTEDPRETSKPVASQGSDTVSPVPVKAVKEAAKPVTETVKETEVLPDAQVDSVVTQDEVEAAEQVNTDEPEAPSKDLNEARTEERTKPIKSRNLVIDGFNKKKTVLNLNDKFMSRFMNRQDNTAMITELTGLTDISEKQKQVVKDFTGFANKMNPILADMIQEKKGKSTKGNDKADFKYQDFNQFLLEDGSLPENVTTAVSASIFNWIAENGTKTVDTEKEVLAKMLLTDAEAVPTDVYNQLFKIGTHRNTVAASLGQKAFQALGLKAVKDVDAKRQSKLEMGLGTLALVAMVQQGYLNYSVVSNADMNDMITKTVAINEGSKEGDTSHLLDSHQFSFVAPSTDVNGELLPKVKAIVESAKKTKGIIGELFSIPTDNKLPSLEPVETTPNTFNRNESATPEYATEVYKKSQANSYQMSANAVKFMDKVSKDDLKELFGYVKPNADGISFDGMHKKFWDGQIAANNALDRSLDIIEEQRTNLEDDTKPFFFEHTIWTNQRSGYDSVFNLQANKVHRAVAGMSDHITEVGVGEATHDKEGLTNKRGEFLMAVAMTAEEIDIGLNTVDKVSSKTYLAAFEEYLQRENVQAGIQSMAAILEGDKVDKADMDNVKALVKEFGMGPMSVRGIQALAQAYIAERDGERTFITDIAFESDGVTNGPIITNVALNTAVDDMLEAGGVFKDKNKTNVPTNKENGSKDIYEQLGEVMKRKWSEAKNAPDIKPRALTAMLALDSIYNAFGERKGAKPIVTTSNYGAGVNSIVASNGREVINSLYKKLEKVNNSQEAEWLSDDLNAIFEYHDSFLKPKVGNVRIKDPMTFLLSPQQEAALMKVSELKHGKAIKDSLAEAMSNFQVVRDILTEHAVSSFTAHEMLRDFILDEALAANTNEDTLVDGSGDRQEGLSPDEMKEALKVIRKYTPSVLSGMGSNSSNAKQSSIPLMKQKVSWDSSKIGVQQFNFKGKLEKGGKGTGNFTVRTGTRFNTVTDPGVSGLALIIQSIDAFIAHTTLGALPTQNYHDANASRVGHGKKMAKVQNEAFVDGLMTTHVNREFTRAVLNSYQGLMNFPDAYKGKETKLLEAFDSISDSLTNRVRFAYSRDIAKLFDMQSWENINQYGTEGGHYTMTSAKRKEITKQIDSLRADMKKDVAQASKIMDFINSIRPEDTKVAETFDSYLMDSDTIAVDDLIPKLQAELKTKSDLEGKNGFMAEFHDSVLDIISNRLPKDLEINYFHKGTAPSNVSGEDVAIANNNPAWFTTGKDGKPQINIHKTDVPVSADVLIHELMHAITADTIAQVRNEPDANPKAKESLDKIDALYAHVKSSVDADPNASDILKYAVKNVDEFIATGFTHHEFVSYLDTVMAPPAARGKNRIVTALRAFVTNTLEILQSFTGRKHSPKTATSLEALILDTTEFLGSVNPVSTGTQQSIFGAPQQARDAVSGYTSKQVFDALNSNLNSDFKRHLDDLMTNVSDTVYAGLDNRLIENKDGSWSPEKAYEEYVARGNAFTTSDATTAGFRMTEQESFAVESLFASIKHVIKDKSMTQVYAEMDKAFKSARDKLKPQDFHNGDWSKADRADKKDAQDMYDFLFKLGPNNKEHLARFTAMALGSEQLHSMLNFSARGETNTANTVFEKLIERSNDALNYAYGLMTNSNVHQPVNSRLGLLSKELARIDAKNRDLAIGKLETKFEQLTDYTDGVSQKIRDRVAELAEKDVVAKSRFTSVRLASNVTRLSAKGDLWTTLDTIRDLQTLDTPNSRLGIMGELINEAANNSQTKDSVEKLLRITKLNNQMKENLRDTTTKNVMSTFEDNGSYLTKEDKSAISNMLRSDVQSLTGHYSIAEIGQMYSNDKFLKSEISSIESQLLGLMSPGQVVINRAKQLGRYMITGKSSLGLAKNAQLIVSGFNTGVIVPRNDPRVELVDRLASMYAIGYTTDADKARLKAVFARELKNKVNGVDTSIKFHKELTEAARNTLFVNNEVSAIKGFVPEITNPNKEIRVATNEAEAQVLKNQFYKEVKSLPKDQLDPTSTNPRLFITEEANVQRLVSGAVEVFSTNRKGTQALMSYKDQAKVISNIADSLPTSPSYDPANDPNVYMTPNYDTKGNVIGFSYEMSAKNRDTLLERNNDFAELLGAYAATNFNKVTVPEQNNRVIDAAFEDYKANVADNARAYVNVGPNSPDQGLREVWAMLPEDTRKHVVKVWGKDGMQVRNDVLLMMFGYRKYSLNQSFDKMDEAKNMFESVYTGIMETVFGTNAKIRGVQVERTWQESVALLKDIIVIRNVKTLVMNSVSNSMLLMAHGVAPTEIVKDTLLSVRSGLQYRKDMAQLLAAQQKQRAGVGDFNKLEQEILKLEDSINRNPLKSFIEEGMMPTIVEDVDPDTNHYSYKSKMQQRIDDHTSMVPDSVKTAAKWAFVSPDTPLYQFLNNATQFSDFSAKYSMYKYYTTKAKEKMSHDEALQTASNNFINYDVPTSRGLQYMNDMGLVMFTKYNVRIQKALFQLLKKRPAAAMAQAVFINSFTNLDAGIDPLIWFNLGMPFRSGALGLPSALDEPLPIKMLF